MTKPKKKPQAEPPFKKLEFDRNWHVRIGLDGVSLEGVKMLEVLWPNGYKGLYRVKLVSQPVTYNDHGHDFPSTEEELSIQLVYQGLEFWLPVDQKSKLKFRRSPS